MLTDYERAILTLDEYEGSSKKHYIRVANYRNWAIYMMIERGEWSDTFWYMAINHKSKEVLENPECYDISELPDIIDMLEDFEYYFN